MNARRKNLLLVEDNAADARLMREAMRGAVQPTDLAVVTDGEQALSYLRGDEPFAGRPEPDIVILDLNLPRKHGLDVLSEIRADPVLRVLPVIVLTTSTSHNDVLEAYGRGSNCYIVKPVDFDHFRQVVAAIDQFWLDVVRLPSASD